VVAQVVQSKTASIKAKLEPSIKRVEQAAKMSLAAACLAALATGIALWVRCNALRFLRIGGFFRF